MVWPIHAGPGRDSIYTDELGEKICMLIATNPLGVPSLCEEYPELPRPQTIYEWIISKPGFGDMYWKAKAQQATALADEILYVSRSVQRFHDKENVQRIDSGILGQAKLHADALRWQAARLEPKRWADQKKVEELETDKLRMQSELNAIKADLDAKNRKEA